MTRPVTIQAEQQRVPPAMSTAAYRTLTRRDFDNGAVLDEIYTALKQRDELIAALTDCVAQSCRAVGGDWLTSFSTSTYADALRLLARLGVVRLTHDAGRAVTAVWVKPAAQERRG